MKKILIPLAITSMLLAGTIFTGCHSVAQKEAFIRNSVLEANQEFQDWQKDTDEKARRDTNAAEWKKFKYHSELTIVNNEFRIADLRARLKEPGTTLDSQYKTKIEKLEQQNKDLKKRIKNFRKDQGDWQTFKTEFKNDLDELGKALKDLSIENLV